MLKEQDDRLEHVKKENERLKSESNKSELEQKRQKWENGGKEKIEAWRMKQGYGYSTIHLTIEQIEALQNEGILPVLKNVNLYLDRDEVAVYSCDAKRYLEQGEKKGNLIITNYRIVFLSKSIGLDLNIPLSLIIGRTKKDGFFTFHDGKNTYKFLLDHPDLITLALDEARSKVLEVKVDNKFKQFQNGNGLLKSEADKSELEHKRRKWENGGKEKLVAWRMKQGYSYSTIHLTVEQIEALQNEGTLPILKNVNLYLDKNEVAVYSCDAKRYSEKNGYPVKNGGNLIITNYRIVFLSENIGLGLNIPLSLVIGRTKKDGFFTFYEGKNTYTFLLDHPDLIIRALDKARSKVLDVKVDNNILSDNMSECDDVIDGMEGHSFEYFCAELLCKNNFLNVEVTRGSGDQGVDILATKDGIKYAIQCKNYKTPLSNTPVQEVNAGKVFYKCHVGVVMTNSTFTSGAKELAEATGVLLWDRLDLQRMLNK